MFKDLIWSFNVKQTVVDDAVNKLRIKWFNVQSFDWDLFWELVKVVCEMKENELVHKKEIRELQKEKEHRDHEHELSLEYQQKESDNKYSVLESEKNNEISLLEKKLGLLKDENSLLSKLKNNEEEYKAKIYELEKEVAISRERISDFDRMISEKSKQIESKDKLIDKLLEKEPHIVEPRVVETSSTINKVK